MANSQGQKKIAIIGGGAAGFFAAINCKENFPDAHVVIFEKTKKVLTKVAISGGGRCNVCNGETSISLLAKAYPRGGAKLKKLFKEFSTKDTMAWFEKRGVKLYTQDDNRVFPVSDDSQTIINCFLNSIKKHRIKLELSHAVLSIEQKEDGRLKLQFKKSDQADQHFDKVIIASGGSPKKEGLKWLEEMGHVIVEPLPSLFTFNMPGEKLRQLMGVVAADVKVKIAGTKLQADGPLLVTHWGISGPAVLKLSSFGARELHGFNYDFEVLINWVNVQAQENIKEDLQEIVDTSPNKLVQNVKPYALPERLWLFLLEKVEIPKEKKWSELGKKGLNKIINVLSHDVYKVKGKTTFKEEFVTCGGVSLNSISLQSMQSKTVQNLYFAGEVLNIDGVTGGYNFQAAWTTAFVAAKLMETTIFKG